MFHTVKDMFCKESCRSGGLTCRSAVGDLSFRSTDVPEPVCDMWVGQADKSVRWIGVWGCVKERIPKVEGGSLWPTGVL
ncbi:MAG: hypothetical protein K9J06_15935 [Flavobacteriales bacterium]|nr:hypothetical protein [Flavobacteriales bacterium]